MLNPDGPLLGDIVIYASERNDGVLSPALVLRTRATSIPGLIEKWPTQALIDARQAAIDGEDFLFEGSREEMDAVHEEYHRVREMIANGEEVQHLTLSGKGRPAEIEPELPAGHLDLLVHGLGGDYRRYNVPPCPPHAEEHEGGTYRTLAERTS